MTRDSVPPPAIQLLAPEQIAPASAALPAHHGVQQLSENVAVVYVNTLGNNASRRTIIVALNALAELLGIPETRDAAGKDIRYMVCPWHALRYAHTVALRARLAAECTVPTGNLRLAALRGVLATAWRLGQIPADEYHRAIDIKRITGDPELRGRALDPEEYELLFATCAADLSPYGARDEAIIRLMIDTTARRSEAAALEIRHYHPRQRTITIAEGKGRKERKPTLMQETIEAIDRWLAVRGQSNGPLFCHIRTGRRKDAAGSPDPSYTLHPDKGLTDRAIYKLLEKRRREAEIDFFTPHDLRRTGITEMIDAGVDLNLVARQSGHASTDMVKLYDRRDERAAVAASDRREARRQERRVVRAER